MFYVIVTKDDEQKVVTDSDGQIREFPKRKKAANFIDGRPYLSDPQIVTGIDEIKLRFKVDL